MSLYSFKSLIALFATTVLLTACGGGIVGSAPPPLDFSVEPGEGGVTLSWTALPSVVYQAYTKQSATICKNCNNANDWTAAGSVGPQARGVPPEVITSPYFFSGTTIQTSLNNDVLYSFIMDGRINKKAAGDATVSLSTTPRLNGANWYSGGSLGSGNVTGLAFGPKLNTSNNTFALTGTYLALGSAGVKYQSTNGLSWTPIAATDTTNWKSATYAFPGTTIQKFVGVGAAGAVVYSSDLVNFSAKTASNQDLNAVASSTGMVVAVGNRGTILRSTDGINWTAAASAPGTSDLYAVTYAVLPAPIGPLWVAVGAGGALWVSSDASTWSALNSGISQDLKGVASIVNVTYPNGIFSPIVTPTYSYAVVAVGAATGNAGTVIRTTDGANWTRQALGTRNLNAIVASSAMIPTNQFMAVGDDGTAFTSPDGVTWTARTTTSSQNLTGLIRGYNNQYLAWAADGSTTYSK